jgi:DNA-binding NtrC family response regulator
MPESPAFSILLADDQPDVLKALQLLFKSEGFSTRAASSPAEMLKTLGHGNFDLALIDLNYTRDTTSGREGLDLLSKIQQIENAPPVVVMTAWGSVELAVEAMRRGARDFVEKPWVNERLLNIVRTQIDLARSVRQTHKLQAELQLIRGEGQPELIARSAAMKPVLELIANVSRSDATILITGENGTGKGVVARLLHQNSLRSGKTLVTVDAASLSPTVFESEIFGHVKGAFTDARADRMGRIEMADGGTLFFDEIGNVPSSLQAKLLRVIESGEFEPVGCSHVRRADVRVIAATNADLSAEVDAGRFRLDLLFRLSTVQIHLPPLRERAQDIEALAEHFLKKHALRYRKQVTGFSPPALRALIDYNWPGNVRQLDHVVERSILMAKEQMIQPGDLGLNRQSKPSDRLEDLTLEEVEKILIQKAMTRFNGNISQAAAALGLSRTALYRRLEKYGLDSPGETRPAEDRPAGGQVS